MRFAERQKLSWRPTAQALPRLFWRGAPLREVVLLRALFARRRAHQLRQHRCRPQADEWHTIPVDLGLPLARKQIKRHNSVLTIFVR
ncbi:MAG: hypothetical protein M0Z28_08285 [Rhodospirillales bacterium]|nr:hypothetical protein [Rhodospirillales bacterium]